MVCLPPFRKYDSNVDENQVQCRRCGHVWVVAPKKRKDAEYCRSCTAKPVQQVKYGGEICLPHRGKFDALDRPIVGGELYLAGERICGHSDCVNHKHIVGLQ